MQFIKRYLKDKSGATAIEYGLIVSLIVIAVIAGITNLGNSQQDSFDKVAVEFTEATR
jgi:pilus assembly protein Flp/PilA